MTATRPDDGTGPTRLRIASYNTRDFLDDRAAAARVVRAIDPDVLCLQEVPRHPGSSCRVRRFAADCGLSWAGGHRGGGGTTILTSDRVATVASRHTRLSVMLLSRRRGYAVVRVRPSAQQGGPHLTVVSVHLSLHAGERHAHTRTILDDVLASAGGPSRVVVAGDVNEHRSGSARRLLESRLVLVSPDTPTYPARRPRSVLDLVLASPDVAVLPHSPVGLDEEVLTRASDHRPVWVDVLA